MEDFKDLKNDLVKIVEFNATTCSKKVWRNLGVQAIAEYDERSMDIILKEALFFEKMKVIDIRNNKPVLIKKETSIGSGSYINRVLKIKIDGRIIDFASSNRKLSTFYVTKDTKRKLDDLLLEIEGRSEGESVLKTTNNFNNNQLNKIKSIRDSVFSCRQRLEWYSEELNITTYNLLLLTDELNQIK